MTFVANAVARQQGRRGHFGMALQAEPGVYVPPTHYLRETGGNGFLPDDLERTSQAFRGSGFEAPAEYAGTDYQGRSVTAEATAADVIMLLTALYGPPATPSGIITPQDDTAWAEYYPLNAVSGQWGVPGAGHVQITDGQVHELTLTVPEQRTEYVSAAVNFHASKAVWHPEGAPIAPFTPAVPVLPGYTGAFGRLDHDVTIGSTRYCPDSTSAVKFSNPIDPLPACGRYINGFAFGDNPIAAEFTMSFAGAVDAVLAASRDKTFLDYVWRLWMGGPADGSAPTKLIKVTARVQVSAREVPISPGRVRTTATFRARAEVPGTSPFSIETKNA